jgi:hypothetical protein
MITNPSPPMCAAVLLALSLILPLQAGPIRPSLPPAGPRVIFYSPTMAERDSIIRIEGPDIAQLLDDFDYYTGRASSYLRQNIIRAEFTSDPLISVRGREARIRILERVKLEDFFGAILTDGLQEPRVLPGVVAEDEFVAEVRNFYRLK